MNAISFCDINFYFSLRIIYLLFAGINNYVGCFFSLLGSNDQPIPVFYDPVRRRLYVATLLSIEQMNNFGELVRRKAKIFYHLVQDSI